jgi:hypothetical protein
MHAIRSIRLLRTSARRILAALLLTEVVMNTPLRFGSLDDILNAFVLFVPVSLLMSAALALGLIA